MATKRIFGTNRNDNILVLSPDEYTVITTDPVKVKKLDKASFDASDFDIAVFSGDGSDRVYLVGNYIDAVDGGGGSDLIYGGLGNDLLVGGDGKDTIYGGSGDDIIGSVSPGAVGGISSDYVINQTNDKDDDLLVGDGFDPVVVGGAVNTAQQVSQVGNDVIAGGQGNDVIWGDKGPGAGAADTAEGGSDTLYGGDGNDVIYGQGGNDAIQGEKGNDTIDGGAGDDNIIGAQGADILKGGAGADVFVYSAALDSTAGMMDTIVDFSAGENDKIDLRSLLGSTDLEWGGGSAKAFGVWQVQTTSSTLVRADTTGDGVADMVIQLSGIIQLKNADFLGVKNAAPTLGPVAGIEYTDTPEDDTFSPASGTLLASDSDYNDVVTFELPNGTASSEPGYDLEQSSPYGTFFLSSSSGAYKFVADDAAIEALKATETVDFHVRATDGSAASSTQTITLTFNGANDTPVLATVYGASYTDTDADDSFADITSTLLGSDRDGDTVTFELPDGTASTELGYDLEQSSPYGTFFLSSSSGAYKFVADDAAIEALKTTATVDFLVRATDGSVASAAQTITLTFNGSNDTPVLATVTGATYTDTDADDGFADVMGTLLASDRDGDTVSFELPDGSASADPDYDLEQSSLYGTFFLRSSSGAYKFVADDAAIEALKTTATFDFLVRATDGSAASATQTITLTFNGANDTPVLATDTGATYTDTEADDSFADITGTLLGSDRDGDTVSFELPDGTVSSEPGYDLEQSSPYGTFFLSSSSGAYKFVADDAAIEELKATEAVDFVVRASDGSAASATQTITLTFNGANDTPVLATVSGVSYTDTDADDSFADITGTLLGSDRDGDTVSFELPDGSASADPDYDLEQSSPYGTFFLSTSSGAYKFVANDAAIEAIKATETVDFMARARDSSATSSTQTIALTFNGANDIPTLIGTVATLADGTEDTPYTILADDLLAGYSDVDGDVLSVSGLSASHGSLADNGNGSWTFTPDLDYRGVVSLNYQVIDGHGGSLAANRSFSIIANAPRVFEFQVNSTTASGQLWPAITALSGGGYVVTWTSYDQDGSGSGIYAQRYDAGGNPQGSEVRVNTTTYNYQYLPAITALSGGGYVVTWASYGQDGSIDGIYAQRYDASGATLGGEVRVNSTWENVQYLPAITALSSGGYVVTWQSSGQDGSGWGIYAQRYDVSGNPQGSEVRVNFTWGNDQLYPAVTALNGGGYVVTWQSNYQDGSGAGIYMQRYDADGNPQGSEVRVNYTWANNQEFPAITALSGGGYVVTWESSGQDGWGYGVYAQRYDASGNPQGLEVRVNSSTVYDQTSPAITALSGGGYVVTWQSNGQDGSGWGIYAQRYDAVGNPQGSEVRVNSTWANAQESPAITALSDGGYVVTWQSNGQDGSSYGIYAQRYDAAGNPLDLALQGNAGDNNLVWTGSGAVTLDGGAGNDTLTGGSANDLLIAGAGNDVINGNGGVDRAAFSGVSSGYDIALIGATLVVTDTDASDGDDGTDRLSGIEQLVFSDGTIQASVLAGVRVNTTNFDNQYTPTITALSGGGYVVTWVSYGQDGSGLGIYAQRYDASGNPLGSEVLVNSSWEYDQFAPAIAALTGGGYVVTWTSEGGGIYAQRYDAGGNPQGLEVRVNSTSGYYLNFPAITALSGGGYVVTWTSYGQDGSGYGIYAQRYDAGGNPQGSEVRVNATWASDQYYPAITALSGGGYVVIWQSLGQDGSGWGIFGQRYDAGGNPQDSEVRVNSTWASSQEFPAITALSDGGYVVTWQSYYQDGSGYGIYAQRYDANGNPQGNEVLVNSTWANSQELPAITALSGGGYVVIWQSYGQDGSGYGIYAQRYDAGGNPLGSEVRFKSTIAGDQLHPAITALSDGGYIVTYTLYSQDGSGGDIYAQRYDAAGNPFGASLTGYEGNNSLNWAGSETVILNGAGGEDTLIGGPGNDVLTGGAGSDRFVLKAVSGVDTVTDFSVLSQAAGGDILDLSYLMVGYVDGSSDPLLFVHARESMGNTIISLDRDGGGSAYSDQDLVTLQGVTGISINDLIAQGNLYL